MEIVRDAGMHPGRFVTTLLRLMVKPLIHSKTAVSNESAHAKKCTAVRKDLVRASCVNGPSDGEVNQ